MVTGRGTVALWSDLGKIGREGKVWYFFQCIGATKAGPVPLKSGKNLRDTQKIMGKSMVYFTRLFKQYLFTRRLVVLLGSKTRSCGEMLGKRKEFLMSGGETA